MASIERRRAMDPYGDYEMDQQAMGGLEYEYRAGAGPAAALAGISSSASVPDYPNDSDTARYDLLIQAVFKRSRTTAYGMPNTMLKRGPMTWIIPIKNLECHCPRIKVNR